MILLIDNYDSFAFNLERYFRELGEVVRVVRNDRISIGEIRRMAPSHLVISPGPCTPAEAGISVEAVRQLEGNVPILGVCLGHQCIAEAYGGRVDRAPRPVHGGVSRALHDGTDLFAGLPEPLPVTRYHSLVVDPHLLPDCLEIRARTASGLVMALRHRAAPMWGVQFHPEAMLTHAGHALLANFVALGRGEPVPAPVAGARIEAGVGAGGA